MRILAIDPGSSLGWATNGAGRLEWGTENFHIKNGESSGNRWVRFGRWLLFATLPRSGPKENWPGVEIVIYERAIFSPKARAAAEIAAGFTTRLEEHCERHGIALEPVNVQTLKAFALPAPPRPRRKKGDPILPRHDQGKEAMVRAACLRLDAEKPCDPILNAIGLGEHEADALWLYWYCKERNA